MGTTHVIGPLTHKADAKITTTDGPLYLPGLIPGEEVSLSPQNKPILLKQHPERTTPPCPYVPQCGGCHLQHMSSTAQNDFKHQLINRALQRQHVVCEEIAPIIRPQNHQRRRVKWHIDSSGKPSQFERGSHNLTPLSSCMVLETALERIMPYISEIHGKLPLPTQTELQATLCKNGVLLHYQTNEKNDANISQNINQHSAFLQRLGIVAIHVGRRKLFGEQAYVHFGDYEVPFPPGGFLQAVTEVEELIADMVCHASKGKTKILELFAGMGTFSLRLCNNHQVTAVEANSLALQALKSANPKPLNIKTQTLDLFKSPVKAKDINHFDMVLLDPPRDGAQAQMKEIVKSHIDHVVYVSCNPISFAKDARHLCTGGFRLKRLTPIDQFVHTYHVEMVGMFERVS
jgi:23S rRNA (uracil1939-C5)-methyltransferase